MRFLFFLLGVPYMILSFFDTTQVLPYVMQTSLMVDGQIVEMTEQEQQALQEQVSMLFDGARTMPAFGVVFDDMYKQEITNGTFISLRFPQMMEVNNLSFDELVFKVEPDWTGVNLFRGVKGVFNGRCIFLDLNKDMSDLHDFIHNLEAVKQIKSSTN